MIFFLNLANALKLDILLSVVLQFAVFQPENAGMRDFVSIVYAAMVFTGFCLLFYFLFKMSLKIQKHNQVYQSDSSPVLENIYVYQKYKEFTQEISEKKSFYVKFFIPINFSKDLLMAIFIVSFGNTGKVQISLCFFISAGLAFMNLKTRPFKSKRLNFLLCSTQLIYGLVDVVFLLMKVSEDSVSE